MHKVVLCLLQDTITSALMLLVGAMFGTRKRLGLEITPTRFRAILLQVSSKRCNLMKALDVEREVESEDRGDHAPAAEELLNLLQVNGMKTGDVRVIFDAHPVSVTTLLVPRSALPNISDSTQWYAEQYSPVPLDKALVNCRVCDTRDHDAVSAVLVATEKNKVNHVLAVLNAAKMKVKRMDIVPFALERLFLTQSERNGDKPTALVGLGDQNASIVVIRGGRGEFVRYFRIFPDTQKEAFVDRTRHTLKSYCDWHPLDAVERIHFYRMTSRFSNVARDIQKATGVEVEELDLMRDISYNNEDVISTSDEFSLNSLAPLIGAAL